MPPPLLPVPLQHSWVPRRGDQGPKTIDQIHKEAEMEEHREHIKVQQLMSKDKRRGPPGPSSSSEYLSSGCGLLLGARIEAGLCLTPVPSVPRWPQQPGRG